MKEWKRDEDAWFIDTSGILRVRIYASHKATRAHEASCVVCFSDIDDYGNARRERAQVNPADLFVRVSDAARAWKKRCYDDFNDSVG